MKTYSPFDKALKDLLAADLTNLKIVNEGWYVEYKSDLVNARALAKAVSAFANTYGGWLFLGVKEQCKDNPVAGEFPGISAIELDGALQRLRQSAAEYLNPTPLFETKVLRGPCVEIGLAEGTSVVVIEIPQSHTAPHVHKDGRIYRRVADGSEPKPETDRFVLDQLWSRANPIRKQTRKWVKRDPEFSEAEGKVPYVRLMFCVDPWCQRVPWLSAPIPEIRSVLTSHDTDIPSITFDTVHTTSEGFIARQVQGNDPHNFVLTWKMQRSMSCDIVFPLPLYTPYDLDDLFTDLDGYDHVSCFIDILKERAHNQPRIADLNIMMNLLISIISKYRRLLKLAATEWDFYFKARVLNAWRIVPFVDAQTVLKEFEAHGLPMIMENTVTAPMGDDPASFARVNEQDIEDSKHEEKIVSVLQAIDVFARIAPSFGVPIFVKDEAQADSTMYPYPELQAAGTRAMTVQQNRNKRLSLMS
ncbi:MAG: ATP-binding protein [Bryobacterales bacterium]|nr:ATP-binding protein [Bryobacterales bacterium]MDE0295849.1 ATP-binding protein [Bryobacterales bacterium]